MQHKIHRITSVSFIAACTLLTTASAVAQGGKGPDLTQQADAVVVGKIASAEPGATNPKLLLMIDRVFKGSLVPGETINILPAGGQPKRAAGQLWGDYAIWFLQSNGVGNWRIMHVPGAQSLESSCYRIPEGFPAASVQGANGTAPSVIDLVLAELTNAAERLDPWGIEFDWLVLNFRHMPPSASLIAAYRRMSESSKIQVKYFGLSGLLKGDAASLEQMPLDDATLAQLPSTVRQLVLGPLGTRDPSPSTIAVLGRIATTQNLRVGTRGSAARSLAMIHTKETLPFLAVLLDSPDSALRSWAFVGFTRFVNNLPIDVPEMMTTMAWAEPQGPAPYRTAETDRHIASTIVPDAKHAEYTSFWKAWWARMQNQIK